MFISGVKYWDKRSLSEWIWHRGTTVLLHSNAAFYVNSAEGNKPFSKHENANKTERNLFLSTPYVGKIQAQDWIRIYCKCNLIFYHLCSETEKKKSCFKHLEVVCSIPSRSLLQPSYYHSFGITENYIVFVEQPFKLDIVKMATAYIRGVNWASCLAFHKDDKVFFLMPSNGVSQ